MLKELPLGKKTVYVEKYAPDLLCPVPRSFARDKTGICAPLPFHGVDIWNAYELSWLNLKGKPQIALAEFSFPCTSPYIVESKSLKLYLNSFNQSTFVSQEEVKRTIEKDLQTATQHSLVMDLYYPSQVREKQLHDFSGICLDVLDIQIDQYHVDPSLLKTEFGQVEETVYSDLLKSNCLATGQPDWGSVLIHYRGQKINHASLLKYIVSFRDHSGFAEHCVEQIFQDIWTHCQPERLTVYGRYTRRGGLDINPFRSNFAQPPKNIRQIRQ